MRQQAVGLADNEFPFRAETARQRVHIDAAHALDPDFPEARRRRRIRLELPADAGGQPLQLLDIVFPRHAPGRGGFEQDDRFGMAGKRLHEQSSHQARTKKHGSGYIKWISSDLHRGSFGFLY